ncbi:APC family permease [Mycoplasmopsis caviae]|uniref:APC family permease n=1 Tax=Mycoplasmopsis caviae TaxID=55603 RepID=A0A3P8KMP5_9BACT|nr:APC family permease [Mycoplasmopsis caviae]UUD35096.1 APC family permease [Mycoplasmopsis caviae]VDR42088.1 Uncharacterised protein [Mycoplasmopsis caviae]
MNNETSKTKQKKITFFAAILMVIGGSTGAGIYFKSESILNNSHQSLILAIFCWIFTALAVITMALALVEISSSKKNNLSIVGWNQIFNSRLTFNLSKNFMVYVYLPLTYFFMPLYALISLQQGIGSFMGKEAYVIGTKYDWIIWTAISLLITIYFAIVPSLYSKAGDIHNKIILGIKFLPLVFIISIGFILAFTNKGGTNLISATVQDQKFNIKTGSPLSSIKSFGAGLGVFLSISAIFFAYDGFYVTSGIQSEMKEPKKTPYALLIGLLITTVIYILIAVAMSINGGSFNKMKTFIDAWWGIKTANIIFGLLNVSIAIGVLGIINSFGMWFSRYVEDLLICGELPLWFKYRNRLNANRPIVGMIYSLVISIPMIVIFSIIGALAYFPAATYNSFNSAVSDHLNKLYNFADLIANWSSLIVYTFIAIAILGGIRNRKTNLVSVNKKKYFLVCAYFSMIVTFIAIIITTVAPFVDVIMLAWFEDKSSLIYKELLIGRIMTIVTLIIYIVVPYLPHVFEDMYFKKKFGSVEKYMNWRDEQLRIVAEEKLSKENKNNMN